MKEYSVSAYRNEMNSKRCLPILAKFCNPSEVSVPSLKSVWCCPRLDLIDVDLTSNCAWFHRHRWRGGLSDCRTRRRGNGRQVWKFRIIKNQINYPYLRLVCRSSWCSWTNVKDRQRRFSDEHVSSTVLDYCKSPQTQQIRRAPRHHDCNFVIQTLLYINVKSPTKRLSKRNQNEFRNVVCW